MSLPSQVNTDKSKHRTPAMKEGVQHTGEVYYGMGPPALKASHGDSASSSGVYNPEKGHQSLPHYQQASSVKWMQDSLQAPGWTQEAPVPAWGQNFGPYVSGVNVRDQMAFHKGVHEGVAMPMGAENQLSAPVEVYRDAAQAQTQGRGLEWEQHTTAAVMHQAQLQAYQHGHKGVDLQGQPHVPAHTMQGPILQPFQASFRPNKPQFSSGYYSVFPANKGMIYGEQPKTQQQLLHQMQQQQMHHHHQQQQQQQQQHMHQQHHLQLQQQHLQQQQQHQMQQHQIQQQQMQQIQQQYHQQQLQEQQQLQQMQQQMQQNVSQPETTQPQVQPKLQQQAQHFGAYPPPETLPPDSGAKEDDAQPMEPESEPQTADASPIPDLSSENVATTNPVDCVDSASAAPRRSRRLSREGQSPLGPPPVNMWSQASKEPPPPPPQNGVTGVTAAKGGESQAATGGVIQTTRRRRRASKEINLETLAQKASEMESLPAKAAKEVAPSNIVPLVIPVSVPVHKNQAESQGGWTRGRAGQVERTAGQADRKPSVIVARRRSLRNSVTESLGQDGESDSGMEEDGKTKFKRRTRPEPLIIPLPKPSTFIPPSVYSSITHYQSNLRSPVRLPDNLHALPPYTPPPILSPVRGGTGLYFTTFLTNIAISNQILPPPATPKSGTRSLLRSTSSEITPPVLPLITDATPVCLEPRINIGQQYQAEIPDLQDQPSSQMDQHKADLVWHPLTNSNQKHGDEETIEHLMNLACSSVFSGGGTNQELVLHCLHECGGNIFETLERLMLQHPIFPKGQHLAGYHYSGSDSWTAEEKCYFNKGITAYRKDFFLVQKLVQTKTVAQCVEFYYTYKKQVKVGRNGILTFGPPDSPVENHSEAVVDVKSSHHPKLVQGEAEEEEKKEDPSYDSYESKQQARVAQSLQAHDYVTGTVLVIKEPDPVSKEAHHSSVPHRPRAEAAVKKTKAPTKPPQDPNEVFPCKKCGRVFNKVKSRSAHMKSHAEQEKKAAALRQKEEEEKAAAQARARKLAAAAKAGAHQEREGDRAAQQGEVSSQDDSSEGEDNDDEDWH